MRVGRRYRVGTILAQPCAGLRFTEPLHHPLHLLIHRGGRAYRWVPQVGDTGVVANRSPTSEDAPCGGGRLTTLSKSIVKQHGDFTDGDFFIGVVRLDPHCCAH